MRRRIVAIVLAVALALACAWTGINVLAVRAYDAATASLARNLEAAAKDDADLDRLSAAQQQTDAQFADAGMLRAVLLPSVGGPIDANTEVSRQLTAMIAAALAAQKGDAEDGKGQSGSGQDGSGQGNGQDGQQQSERGLSEEQQQKVDELIRQNQQLQSAAPTPSASSTTSSAPGEQSTAKPW